MLTAWSLRRALELGQDSQHAEQEAQVGSDGRLQQDGRFDPSFDFRAERVDDQPMFVQYVDYVVVGVRERVGRRGQVRRDQGEQLDDLGIDSIQLTLKCLPLLGHS
jgi:hypothetical protein